MSLLSRLFGRAAKPDTGPKDMRVKPVDNPLDYREDGSIQPGDPAYDLMMEVLRSDKPIIASQRDDGTWETERVE